jgi:hypothetical protein
LHVSDDGLKTKRFSSPSHAAELDGTFYPILGIYRDSSQAVGSLDFQLILEGVHFQGCESYHWSKEIGVIKRADGSSRADELCHATHQN